MGLHREATLAASAPFFLTECRRKAFIKAYYLDMVMSSLFSRPPRILRRYSDCNLPLNLADDEILGTPEQLEQALGKLSPEGWNMDGKYYPTTSIRLRCMGAEIREEVLAYEYRTITIENLAELEYALRCLVKTAPSLTDKYRNLVSRSGQIRRNLPPHLKHTTEGAQSDRPAS